MASDAAQDFVLLDDGDLQDYNERGLLPQSPEVLKQIYDWLEPTAYDDGTSEYLRHLKSHVRGTGDWLTATDEYKRWHDSEEESVLWIRAVPGAGKSVLAAHQRAHLSTAEKAPVLHFFFRQIITSNRTPKQLVRDWIAQLIPYSPPLQKQLYEIIETDRKTRDDVPFDNLWQMAQGAIQALPRVYCFADALDEMSVGYDDFLTLLVRLGSIAGCKVFMTSRPVPRIVEILRKESIIRIVLGPENMDEDISVYVDHRLDRDLARYIDHRLQISGIRLGDEGSREATEDLIRTTLRRKAQGSFLYARLMMDNLLEALQKAGGGVTLAGIHVALDALPTGLSEMYSGMLRDHAQRTGTSRELQLSILRWVTHSERPLRLLELSAVVDFEGGTLQRAKDTKSIVRTACGPLLEILPSDVVGPVHHSFTEYLTASVQSGSTESQPVHIESASTHRVIAGYCVKYIVFVYETDDNRKVPAEDLYVKFPFLSYAVSHWHAHVRKSGKPDPELISLLDRLLIDESCWRIVWLEVAMKFRPRPSDQLLEQFSKGEAKAAKNLTTPVHTSARVNLGEYITRLHDLGHDLNARDKQQQTPAHHAADSGSVDSLKALLEAGANLNEADRRGHTPLHLAAQKGRAEAVEMLLETGIDAFTPKTINDPGVRCGNARPTLGDTPVQYAARGGHVETSKVFARYVGVERIPYILFWALQGDNSKIALEIIEDPLFDANGEVQGMYPLYMACLNRDLQCMQALIDKKASLDTLSDSAAYAWPVGRVFTTDNKKRKNMPLHGFVCGRSYARGPKTLKRPDDELIQGLNMLLDAGCPINAKDGEGFSPLYHAQNNYIMTSILLARGADPKSVVREDGSTPLHVVAGADLKIMRLWMDHGLDINARDNQGFTPLIKLYSTGVHVRNIDKVRNLLALGADPNIAMRSGTTPLHLARCDSDDSMTLLLQAGADVRARDSNGNTPILVDANGSKEIAALLQAGADMEAKNNRGESTFLSQIARGTHFQESGLEKLLELKPNVFAQDAEGATALHLACLNTRISSLKELLGIGLSPTAVDNRGNTIYHYWMERYQCQDLLKASEEFLQISIEREINPQQANIFGHTPLHIAVFNGNESMVAILVGSRCNLNINATDHWGLAPIHIAAARSTALTALLLEKGADPTSITRTGQGVLHFAALAGDPNTLALLLSSIAAMKAHLTDLRDDQQYTALHYAARSGVPRSVKLLLDAGANPNFRTYNARDRSIMTPLHLCCQSKMEDETVGRLWHQEQTARQPELNKPRSWCRLQEDWQTWSRGLCVKNPYNRSKASAKQCAFHLLAAGADIFPGSDIDTCRAAHQISLPSLYPRVQSSLECAVKARCYSVVDELLRANDARPAKTDEEKNALSTVLQSVEFAVYEAEKKHLQMMLQTTTNQMELDKLIQYLIDQDRSEILQYLSGDWRLLGQHLRRLAELGHHQTLHLIRANLTGLNASPQDFVPASWPRGIGMMPHWVSQRFSSEPIDKILPAPLDGLLLAACKAGCRDLDVVKTIVEGYGCSNIEKTWALFKTRDDQILQYLVQHGADINAQTPAGMTVLLERCVYPPPSTSTTNNIATLLRNGADPNILDVMGQSCLGMAADRLDLVRLLMAHGANPQRGTPRPIIRAIALLNLDVIPLLTGPRAELNTEGIAPDLPDIVLPDHEGKKRNDEQQYPMLFALMHHYQPKHYHPRSERHTVTCQRCTDLQDEVLRVLLEAGADPYAITSRGSPILHEALLRGKRLGPVLDLPGLDLECRDADNRTLLLAAVDSGNHWVVGETCQNNLRSLLDIGARIDAVDSRGRTVLHCIADNSQRSADMVNIVIDRPDGEKLIAKTDNEGRLAIHVLQMKQDWKMYKFLAGRGADTTIPDPEGNSVLHWLFLFKGVHQNFDDADEFSSFVRSILSLGIDINRLNNDGEPAMMNLLRGIMQACDGNVAPWRVSPPPPSDSTNVQADKEAQAARDYIRTFNFLWNEAGMDIRTKSAHAQNALHMLAAQKPDGRRQRHRMGQDVMRELWKLLVDAGLDPWEEDDEQRSALDIAAASGNVTIMELY